MVDFTKLMENKTMQNKTTETETNNNGSVWTDGSIEDNEQAYIKFEEAKNNTIQYKMLCNDPVSGINKFGNVQWTFEVMDLDTQTVVNHSITSKQYMRVLNTHRPLEGKSFCVRRSGTEYTTEYQVTAL